MHRQSTCNHSHDKQGIIMPLPFGFRSEPEGSDDQRPGRPEVAQSETEASAVGTIQSEGIFLFFIE
jgi:hypothetical protein